MLYLPHGSRQFFGERLEIKDVLEGIRNLQRGAPRQRPRSVESFNCCSN